MTDNFSDTDSVIYMQNHIDDKINYKYNYKNRNNIYVMFIFLLIYIIIVFITTITLLNSNHVSPGMNSLLFLKTVKK